MSAPLIPRGYSNNGPTLTDAEAKRLEAVVEAGNLLALAAGRVVFRFDVEQHDGVEALHDAMDAYKAAVAKIGG